MKDFMSDDTPIDVLGAGHLVESPPLEAIRYPWPSPRTVSYKSVSNANVSVSDDFLSERALVERQLMYDLPKNSDEWVQGLPPLFEESSTPRKSTKDDLKNVDDDCSSGRSPSPWLEMWFEKDGDMKFGEFAAKMIAECPNQNGLAREFRAAGADHSDTGSQRADNDAPLSAFDPAQSGFGNSNRQAKRLRDDPGDGSDDDGPPGPKRQMVMRPPSGNVRPRPMYACPYQKQDPRGSPLCGMPHGAKRDYGWDSVSRVKQHLLESHGRDHHCQNCWKAFKKVEHAVKCPSERKCFPRECPPKKWLTEEQIILLRAERIPSQGDDGWYRIFDYCELDKTSKSVLLTPTSSVTPNSMWTPSSGSTSFTPKCPDTHLISQAMDEDSVVPDETFTEMFQELAGSPAQPRPSANGNDAFTVDHGFPMAPLPETPLWTPENPGFDTSASRNMDRSIFGAAGVPPASCSCMGLKFCGSCRLKERNSTLRSENRSLRSVLDLIKSTVDEHYEVLSDVDEQGLLSPDTMAKLWTHQEQLGKHLQF
ncbi:hypothetical protein B0J13DRAFT_609708 [Dactylonectria estremocensis]|uniref:C2H2-type domain-containing protein n=1 Tax=Dactylonectria estremocensis TaxID=1079267 RepID=A0A9P9IX26_9HYPO|nr:hypothetical protein B0J13DRAFT_609708 [Dactylonectria estremocensis]